MRLLTLFAFLCISKSIAIVIVCDLKHSNVGHGHYDTCESSNPPLDTTGDKIVQSALGWSKSRTTDDVKQLYTEFVNCIFFPYDLSTVFPELEVVRLFQSKVKYIENMDMKNLVKLKVLDLEDNDIEVLQSDLFIHNLKLKEIHLQKNKIKFIAARVFSPLSLIVLRLEGNLCISGDAINDISAMLTLKTKVDESCSAPEFLLENNVKLIRNLVDLNFTLMDVTKTKDTLLAQNINLNVSLLSCEDDKQNAEREQFRLNAQLKKDASSIKRLNSELQTAKETSNELTSENVKLSNEVKKANQNIKDAEEKLYELMSSNKVCAVGTADSLIERTLRYENEKLTKENLELKTFKQEVEREWRTIRLECQFVVWNNVYTCQSDNFKVKLDDSEVIVDGKHAAKKSNYDVKKLIIYSQEVKTIFLPNNLGAVFPKVQSIIIQNSNLILIKIENFDNMADLKELLLDHNSIEDIPQDTFSYPQKLERLSLAFNNIRMLNKDLFSHIKNLKYLMLNNNKIQKIHAELFKFNNKLELIALQNNDIKHIDPKAFENLKKLSLINLEKNQCVSGKFTLLTLKTELNAITSKCSAPETQEVYCKYEDIDPDYTCSMIDLRVDSDYVIVSSVEGDHVATRSNENVKQLRVINQDMRHFPNGFSKFYKNIEKIIVRNSQLMAIGENDFKGLIKMKQLTLSSNKISFVDGKCFNDLVNLEILSLSNNQITELAETTFSMLTKLKDLDISANKIQKLSQNLLSKNVMLEKLNASGNKLTHIGAAIFNNKRNIQEVNLISNECINERMPDVPLNELKLKILDQCQ